MLDTHLDTIGFRIDALVDRARIDRSGWELDRFSEALAGFVVGAVAGDVARRMGGEARAKLVRMSATARVPRPGYAVDELLDESGETLARNRVKQWLGVARRELRRMVAALVAMPGGEAALRAASEDDLIAERVAMKLELGTFSATPVESVMPVENYCWMRIR